MSRVHQTRVAIIAFALSSRLTSSCGAAEIHAAADLASALSRAKPGDVITLAPGYYDRLAIKGVRFASPVIIRSADASRPAVVWAVQINDSSGLTFQDLDFSTSADAPGAWGAGATTAFQVAASQRIRFDQIHFHGAENGTLATDISGLIIRTSVDVIVSSSRFEHLHNAIEHEDDSRLTITGNAFRHIWDDSIRGGGSSNVVIVGNRFESDHMDAHDADHPDCVQFWTTNTKTSAHDIWIKNNLYLRGDGRPIQGVFMRDETGDTPYLRVFIINNILLGGLWHGISVYNGRDIEISGNTVAGTADQPSRISVFGGDQVALHDNAADQYLVNSPPARRLRAWRNTLSKPVTDGGEALVAAWRARQ